MVHDEDDLVARIVNMTIDAVFARLEAAIKATAINAQLAAVAEIRELYAGTSIHIPKGTTERIRTRNAELHARNTTGLSVRELAREFHLSETSVRRILEGKLHTRNAIGLSVRALAREFNLSESQARRIKEKVDVR